MPYSFNPFTGNFDNTPSTLKGDVAYSNLVSNSATWVDAYETGTVYKANSATYATIDFANSKFFPLTGGLITGNTRINGNVTIFGDLTSTGTQTFANTVFTTTSSLSIVHYGQGPALYVGQDGSGDIASFYDIDQGVEVLHIGGINAINPNVGVKTSTPNKDFTVNGEISSNNIIWDANGNSDQWNSTYNTVQTNSATTWNYQGTDLKSLSANWQGTYTNYSANSASYATQNYVGSNFYPLSGGTLNGSITATDGSFDNVYVFQQDAGPAVLYAFDYKVGINTESPNESLTVVGNVSATNTIYANYLELSSVKFTNESVSNVSSVTASNDFLKVVVGNSTKYLRLYNVE